MAYAPGLGVRPLRKGEHPMRPRWPTAGLRWRGRYGVTMPLVRFDRAAVEKVTGPATVPT